MKNTICCYCAILLVSLASSICRAEQFNALVITKTEGWHHSSIHEGIDALQHLAKKHFFKLTWEKNIGQEFNEEKLKDYDVIIFLLTSGDILNSEQQALMENFIRAGKGFVGIHSASDTEYEWPWYTQLVGHSFYIHPVIQTAKVQVIDRTFPGLEGMRDSFLWTDEWYEFGKANTKGLNYILKVDEGTYDPVTKWDNKSGTGMGRFHPIAWHHNFDGGRSFYTALGHTPELYSDSLFQEHIYGGIYWAATGKGLIVPSDK